MDGDFFRLLWNLSSENKNNIVIFEKVWNWAYLLDSETVEKRNKYMLGIGMCL